MPVPTPFALQNDLFLAAGLNLFVALPTFQCYWNPAICQQPLVEQSQRSPRSRAAVTRTVTLRAKPVTMKKTSTVHDTITKNVTSISTTVEKEYITKWTHLPITPPPQSVSTIVDRRYITKWTHFPTEKATPCAVTAQSKLKCAPCPPRTSCAPCPEPSSLAPLCSTKSVSPMSCTNLALLALWIVILGTIALVVRPGLISRRVVAVESRSERVRRNLEAERDRNGKLQTQNRDLETELEQRHRETVRLAQGLEKRDEMLTALGMLGNDDKEMDEERLQQMLAEKKNILKTNEGRLRELEAENVAVLEKVRELEAQNATMKEQTSARRGENHAAGSSSGFQSLLDSKQKEINYWRDAFYGNDMDAAIQDNYRRCEEQEEELVRLRNLTEGFKDIEKALSDSRDEIESLKKQMRDQSVADRRRWMLEKADLTSKHEKTLKALRTELKEVKQSLSPSTKKSIREEKKKENEELTATKEIVASLKAEQTALLAMADKLQAQLAAMADMVSTAHAESDEVRKERDALRESLQKLQNAEKAKSSRDEQKTKEIITSLKTEQTALLAMSDELQKQLVAMADIVSAAHAESEEVSKDRDALREELEKTRGIKAEQDALNGMAEKLQKELLGMVGMVAEAQKESEGVRKERDALREALEKGRNGEGASGGEKKEEVKVGCR